MPCTAPIRRSSTNGCSSRRAVTASGPSTRTWVSAPGAGSVASPSLERPEGSGASPHTCAPSRRAAGSSTSTTSPATPRSRAGRRRKTTWPCARTRGASPPIPPGPSGSIPGATAGSSPRSVTSGPVFDDFVLRPDPSERIRLRWGQRGPDRTFLAREAGDGTLRLVRLAALLPGPDSPATVVLDEPELGLHPVATDLPAEMTRTAGRNGREVILATQSVPSVPHFELDEIVVLSGVAGATQVSRSDGGIPRILPGGPLDGQSPGDEPAGWRPRARGSGPVGQVIRPRRGSDGGGARQGRFSHRRPSFKTSASRRRSSRPPPRPLETTGAEAAGSTTAEPCTVCSPQAIPTGSDSSSTTTGTRGRSRTRRGGTASSVRGFSWVPRASTTGTPVSGPSSCSTRSRRSSSRRSTPTRGEGLLPEPALNEPRDVIGRAGGPELVDDGPGTAPSERLERADPNCSRTVTGPLPIAEAGLGAVLERCPVFAAWWRGIIVP